MKQQQLVQVPAKLTPRQAHALALLQAAGADGLTPVLLGAALHDWSGTHPAGRTCDYCHSAGSEVLRALRRKGVARCRRVGGRMVWQATVLSVVTSRGMLRADQEIF